MEDPAVVLSGRMTLSLITPRIPTPLSHDHPTIRTKSTENLHENGHNGDQGGDMKVEVSNIVVMEKLETHEHQHEK